MLIVGITGGTGSGKTTLSRTLVRKLGKEDTIFIPHDNYYRDRSHLSMEKRKELNYDHPESFETELLISQLKELKAGRPVRMPLYDFSTHTRKKETVLLEPRPIVILEGILVLAEKALRSLLDIKIFVDTDADIRILRRLRRDILERDRSLESVYQQYLSTVKPMHEAFVEPSKRYADIIVPDGGLNEVASGIILTRLEAYMESNLARVKQPAGRN